LNIIKFLYATHNDDKGVQRGYEVPAKYGIGGVVPSVEPGEIIEVRGTKG
jgi:hypothetical protein